MTRWDMLMNYLARLPYPQRLLVGGGMVSVITALLCILVYTNAKNKAPGLMLISLVSAFNGFMACVILATSQTVAPLGLGGILGYAIGLALVLRWQSINRERKKKGPRK